MGMAAVARPGGARARIDQIGDDAAAARLSSQERRAVQRSCRLHRVLGPAREANGDQYLVDTNLVEDPVYLQTPWITALHFKKEPDASKWDPTPCDARF
jgi:hypothetical protein